MEIHLEEAEYHSSQAQFHDGIIQTALKTNTAVADLYEKTHLIPKALGYEIGSIQY